jgi:hypothetical protein
MSMTDGTQTTTQTTGTGGGTGDGTTQTTQTTQTQQTPFWNDLPENMRGATAEDTLKKVMPAFQGYHKAAHERGPVLSKPEELTLEITHEKAKPFFDPKSPMATQFAKAAVDAGLTKKQAATIADKVMGGLADAGALADMFDPKANVAAIAKVLGHTEINDAAKTALQQFETESLAWAANTAQQMKLSDAAKIELESLTLTPGGVEIIKALRAQGGAGIALGGQGAGGGGDVFSLDELKQMDKDPRIDPYKQDKFDKAVREKYDRSYQHHYSKKN